MCRYPLQITLTGLGIVIFNFGTLLYYDPLYLTETDGYSNPPKWIYFTLVSAVDFFWKLFLQINRWAVGLFLYQTLDAIDG